MMEMKYLLMPKRPLFGKNHLRWLATTGAWNGLYMRPRRYRLPVIGYNFCVLLAPQWNVRSKSFEHVSCFSMKIGLRLIHWTKINDDSIVEQRILEQNDYNFFYCLVTGGSCVFRILWYLNVTSWRRLTIYVSLGSSHRDISWQVCKRHNVKILSRDATKDPQMKQIFTVHLYHYFFVKILCNRVSTARNWVGTQCWAVLSFLLV